MKKEYFSFITFLVIKQKGCFLLMHGKNADSLKTIQNLGLVHIQIHTNKLKIDHNFNKFT